jgi:hypothetical protein
LLSTTRVTREKQGKQRGTDSAMRLVMRLPFPTPDQTNRNTSSQRAAVAAAVALMSVVGCSSAPDDAVDTAAQASSTSPIYDIVPQDVTAVWWIASFNPFAYVEPLCQALPDCKRPCDAAAAANILDPRAIDDRAECEIRKQVISGLLEGLAASANIGQDPQSLYSNAEWNDLKWRRDYRGYLKISNMTLRCQDGQTIPWDDGSYFNPVMEQSPGYTLLVESEWKSGYPRNLDVTNNGSCVDFHQVVSSRLGNALGERFGLWVGLGLNAPFIYADANVRVCCDGSVSVDIQRSIFPTMAVFNGGAPVTRVAQADLVGFMVSPGTPPPIPPFQGNGDGTFAPGGQGVSYVASAYVYDENQAVTP